MLDGRVAILKESSTELVVVKPAGMSSEGDPHALRELVARERPGTLPKLPHRLDRVTRGVLLVCLTPEAIAFHNEQIRERRWEKYYLARVGPADGVSPEALLGKHKAFLVEENGRARIVRSGGKPAWLDILAAAPAIEHPGRFHLLIRLLTGRFHQIRVMCAALGLPLAGDPLYDSADRAPDEFYLEHIVLKYTDFDSRAVATYFVREDRDRGVISPSLRSRLTEIAARPELVAG